MFEDEQSSKRFLTLENSKSSYNIIIEDSTKTKKTINTDPNKFSRNLLVNSNQFIIFSLTLTDLKIIS